MKTQNITTLIELMTEGDPQLVMTPRTREILTAVAPVLEFLMEDDGDTDDSQATEDTTPVIDEDYLEAMIRASPLLPEPVWMWVDGRCRVTLMNAYPTCDLCGKEARYDAPVPAAEDRGHYLCTRCWEQHSTRQLGWGLGQLLATEGDLPAWVAALASEG